MEKSVKNFQQTPKQRRKAKAEMAGFKAKLRASNPNHEFQHERDGWNWKIRNYVIRKGKL